MNATDQANGKSDVKENKKNSIIGLLVLILFICFAWNIFGPGKNLKNKSDDTYIAPYLELVSGPKGKYKDGGASVTGTIRADTHVGGNIYVLVRFYDKHDALVSEGRDIIGDLYEGDKGNFEVLTQADNISYYKVIGITN